MSEPPEKQRRLPLRFNRREFAGAFGDVGLDIPLLVLLILTCRLDARSVLIVFGASQIFAGLAYRLPIPVQPLKAMAAIAIAEGLSGDLLIGGGLAIGAIMLVLSLSGGLSLIARLVPKPVVRGLQVGLGVKLGLLACRNHLPALGVPGYVLAAAGVAIVLLLRSSHRFPPALLVLALGLVYVFAFQDGWSALRPRLTPGLPAFGLPAPDAILTGLLLLAIPQLPLSLGNAVLATRQTVHDLFDGHDVPVRKLGLTYSAINLVAPLFGGIPVCHGSGGVAGHYAFGARTGGSVIIYGAVFLVCGTLFAGTFFALITVFPRPLLAVLLLFEGLTLVGLARDMLRRPAALAVVLLVAGLAVTLPYGFCIALVAGTLVHAALAARRPHCRLGIANCRLRNWQIGNRKSEIGNPKRGQEDA